MLSPKVKQQVALEIQELLQSIQDDELPTNGEISFILHVDGKESWSWVNIRNESDKDAPVPSSLVRNLSV